jgi:PAS domain S-box-containing protein
LIVDNHKSRDKLISKFGVPHDGSITVPERSDGGAEQMQAELTLPRESEECFCAIFENIRDVFWMVKADLSEIIYVSPSYETVWGRSCASLYNNPQSWMDYIHPLDIERIQTVIGQRGDAGHTLEYQIIRPDGTVRWMRDRRFSVRERNGQVDAIAGIAEDITESKSAEESLRKSEEFFRLTLGATNDGLWDWNVQNGKAFFSPCYYTMLGYDPYEFPQDYDSWRSLLHPDDVDRVEQQINEHIKRGEGYAIEARMKSNSGGWVWVLMRGKLVEHDADGHPLRMVGTNTDITEHRLAEERLRESEERYRTVIESSPEGVALMKGNDAIYVNQCFWEMFGYETPEEILKVGMKGTVHPDNQNMLSEYARRRQQGDTSIPRAYEFRGVKKDGTTIFVDVSVAGVRYQGERVSLTYFRDVTHQKKAENALRENEERFRLLFEKSVDPTLLLDGDTFIECNEAAVRLMGCSEKAQLIGLRPFDLSPERQPDGSPSSEKARELIDVALRTGMSRFEWVHRGFNGEDLWIDVSLSTAPVHGKRIMYTVWRDITERKRAEGALQAAHQQLIDIIEFFPDAVFVIDRERRVIAWNKAIEEMTGVKKENMLGKGDCAYAIPFYGTPYPVAIDLVLEWDEERARQYDFVKQEGDTLLAAGYVPMTYKGKGAHLSEKASPLFDAEGRVIGAIESIRDVTEHKQTEDALRSREYELEDKSANLEDANTALKVLLRQREEDRGALESTILANVKELVFPYIERLQSRNLTKDQVTCLGIIESNLNEVISPFLRRMTAIYAHFTPMEIQVANLIKNGSTSKEIAEILKVGMATVHTHRNSIRGKLSIRNKAVNLRSYLLSLQE